MATLRTISATGREAMWKKDKTVLLSALEDFQFFTFADLDYFTVDQTVLASFSNFRTDDIIKGNDPVEGVPNLPLWDANNGVAVMNFSNDALEDDSLDADGGSRVRITYAPYGTDLTDTDNPIVGEDTVNSTRSKMSIYRDGVFGTTFPGYNTETGAKVEYPIYDIGYRVIESVIDDPLTPSVDESSKIWHKEHFVVLQNTLENEDGIDWIDDYAECGCHGDDQDAGLYSWQVVIDAWVDVDIVINDARFFKVDKQSKFEVDEN